MSDLEGVPQLKINAVPDNQAKRDANKFMEAFKERSKPINLIKKWSDEVYNSSQKPKY